VTLGSSIVSLLLEKFGEVGVRIRCRFRCLAPGIVAMRSAHFLSCFFWCWLLGAAFCPDKTNSIFVILVYFASRKTFCINDK